MGLQVSFVRHRQRRDRVYVTRHDGSSTAWDFPSYGDRLPHDLCHLVVEEELGIVDGFWGLVDQGVEVELVDNQATLVRDGSPLVVQPGVDFSDLVGAEEAVALLAPTGIVTEQVGAVTVARLDASSTSAADRGLGLPDGASPDAVASVRRRLRDLGEQWRRLEDGEAITLPYSGRTGRTGRTGHTH
jgi:hypothetical protein